MQFPAAEVLQMDRKMERHSKAKKPTFFTSVCKNAQNETVHQLSKMFTDLSLN
jgi:hypothetical protein